MPRSLEEPAPLYSYHGIQMLRYFEGCMPLEYLYVSDVCLITLCMFLCKHKSHTHKGFWLFRFCSYCCNWCWCIYVHMTWEWPIRTCRSTTTFTNKGMCLQAYIHTRTHTYIHAKIHTRKNAYIHMQLRHLCSFWLSLRLSFLFWFSVYIGQVCNNRPGLRRYMHLHTRSCICVCTSSCIRRPSFEWYHKIGCRLS